MYDVREEDAQETCSSWNAKTSRTCQPPVFTSHGSSTWTSRKKDSCCFHVQTDLSNSSIFLNPPRGKTPARGNLEQDGTRRTGKLLRRRNGEYSWSMSGVFTYRHQEEHRAKLYIPGVTTFSVSRNFVGVMRQNENKHRFRLRIHVERLLE